MCMCARATSSGTGQPGTRRTQRMRIRCSFRCRERELMKEASRVFGRALFGCTTCFARMMLIR